MKLSILDQAAVAKNSDTSRTLKESLEMAQYAENLGYSRYWFAEHHGTRGLASVSPEILMAAAASVTKSIRVGSGGVLLPQYSPYKTAENFRQLESLFPGRIDAGIGRSPGGTEKVRAALLDQNGHSMSEFPRKLDDFISFLTNHIPRQHPLYGIKTAPLPDDVPPVWLLGLGENSAAQTGALGLNYVFGHFIKPDRGQEAFKMYRESFVPSHFSQKPEALAAVFVICGRTDEEAEELALSQDLWLLRAEKGLDSRVPGIEEAKAAVLKDSDWKKIKQNRRRMVIGGPAKVRKSLDALAERYETDEIMVLANVFSFEEKKQSFLRLAEMYLS
ncbi:MsnO8 family LLM class oxidoreductase [Bacillus mangrovi]|uniref:MsnO8 family LLM class oxidoreductase n=1 Tax=Metabacillus mangrovi TaxID=1491830 RepID=A0A7X2S1K9_9BACI|nr:LLM class flavin-dependent oxidoreductase [Metabacillus mangrovi]MTH51950.1 MsnO8 family LLM class oxidoreductase [Metabacillus mangrovi]